MQHYNQTNDVSVLILSYERPEYLQRTLCFLREHNITTLVVDGSKKSIDVARHFKDFDALSYLYFPGCDYISRLKLATKALETKYVILLQDDGFLNPSGLNVAVRALRADETLAAVIGSELSLRVVGGRAAYWMDEREFASATKDYSGDAITRMTEYFQIWYPRLLYSCMTTEALKSATLTLPSRNLYSLDFELLLEPHVELMVLLYGRVLKIPDLLSYRSFENKSVRNLADPSVRMGDLTSFEWFDSVSYKDEVDHYLDSIFIARKESCFNERGKFFDIMRSWTNARKEDHTSTSSWFSSSVQIMSRLGLTGRCLSLRSVKKRLNTIFNKKLFSICLSGDEVVPVLYPNKTDTNVTSVTKCICEFVANRKPQMFRKYRY